MMFAAGTILVSSSSLMAPWLQNLANYPVEQAGLIMAPRGIGTMLSMVLAGRVAAVLFSPVHGVLDPKDLAAWILDDKLEVRLQLQVHKFIWGPDVRGV